MSTNLTGARARLAAVTDAAVVTIARDCNVTDCDELASGPTGIMRLRTGKRHGFPVHASHAHSSSTSSTAQQHTVRLIETVAAHGPGGAITWTLEVVPLPQPGMLPFRAPIGTLLNLTALPADATWWAPRTGDSDSDDILAMMQAGSPARTLAFGGVDGVDQDGNRLSVAARPPSSPPHSRASFRQGRGPVATPSARSRTTSTHGGGQQTRSAPSPAETGEETPLPLTVTFSRAQAFGVAVLPSMNDTTLAGALAVGASGTTWERLYDRLDHATGRPVRYTTYLLGLGTAAQSRQSNRTARTDTASGTVHRNTSSNLDASPVLGLTPAGARNSPWRPAMAWLQQQFPVHLLPHRRFAEGLGVYSCASADSINASALSATAATLQWDAHFWWPYIGMTMPPNTTWGSNTGSGEETQCGTFVHGQRTSRATMADYYTALDTATNGSMHALSYFNLFEFGEDVVWPLQGAVPTPADTDWTNSSLYLWHNLNASVLQAGAGKPTYTWQNAIVLDPASVAWSKLLLDAATGHTEAFGSTPGWGGLIVDRTDHTRRYNMFADDGRSWCGSPCRALLPPFIALSQQVGEIVRSAGGPNARMYSNLQDNRRADTLLAFDGVFTEASDGYPTRNAAALASMAMPAVSWTYSADELLQFPAGGPDGYLQAHLYRGVAPMAPIFGADHSIPSAVPAAVLAAYADHGPLFAALSGAVWLLRADAVTLDTDRAAASNGGAASGAAKKAGSKIGSHGAATEPASGWVNAFVRPGAAQMAIAQGATDTTADIAAVVVQHPGALANVTVADVWSADDTVACGAMWPGGSRAWTPVPSLRVDDTVRIEALAVVRGCAVVRCVAGSL